MRPAAPRGLRLRGMRRGDVATIVEIEADRHTVDAWSSAAFHDALDRPDRSLCVVVAAESPHFHDQQVGAGGGGDGAGEELIAYAVMTLADDTADVDNLTVRADRARRGVGRWLLASLLEAADRRGVLEVLLEVRHDNDPAIALYTAAGFVPINRRSNYYAPGLDAIVMRRSLIAAPPAGPPKGPGDG